MENLGSLAVFNILTKFRLFRLRLLIMAYFLGPPCIWVAPTARHFLLVETETVGILTMPNSLRDTFFKYNTASYKHLHNVIQ